MSSPAWLKLQRALADTGVFILWYRGGKTLLSQSQHRNLLQPSDAKRIAALADQRCGAQTNIIDVGKLETDQPRCVRDRCLQRTPESLSESATSSGRCPNRRYRTGKELAARDDQCAALQIDTRDRSYSV